MSAVLNQASAQYRVQAYKKIMSENNVATSNIAPCMREEADCWWIEKMIGPNRWSRHEMRDTEAQALGRLAELTGRAPIEKTHYGYSTPRI
jgi:hypothetical protein